MQSKEKWIETTARMAKLVALAVVAAAAAGPLGAQTNYPTKAIALLVPSAPGGTTDLAARMIAEPLSKALGQPVVVENRAGANGVIAATAVKRAEPDGYTLIMQYSGYHVISPLVTKGPPQWTAKDLTPVANVLSAPQVIVAREGTGFKTLGDMIAYAKANPAKLSYASSGAGSLQHATGAMLEQQAGIQMVHVPYKGTAPALQDLLGGTVDVTFGTPPPFIAHIKAGKLRALAVTTSERISMLPDVPTAAEAGVTGIEVASLFGVMAPAGTPAPIVAKLNAEIQKILATPEAQEQLLLQGAYAIRMTPEQSGERIRKEISQWAKVIDEAKIKTD